MLAAAVVLALALLFWTALTRNTSPVDWQATYYPAARALLELGSPYARAPLFFAPVWSLFPLLPFAIFTVDISGALFFVVSLLGFAYLGYRMGCSPVGILALLLSAPVFNCIQTGNIEWIPLLGAFLPAPLGLVLLSMKPQSTLAIMAFIAVGVVQKQGMKKLVLAATPTLLLTLLSWAVFGPWFLRIGGAFDAAGVFVLSVWPYGLPVGLFLLYLAIRRHRLDYAVAASPLLSPYAILLTWSGFVLSFAKSTRAMIVVSVLSWALWLGFRYWVYR